MCASGKDRSCFSYNLFNQQLPFPLGCPADLGWSCFWLLAALALRGQDRNLLDGHVSPFKRVTILDRLTGKQPHRIDAGGRIPCRAVFGASEHDRVTRAGVELQLQVPALPWLYCSAIDIPPRNLIGNVTYWSACSSERVLWIARKKLYVLELELVCPRYSPRT
jgi:hypothetical protein